MARRGRKPRVAGLRNLARDPARSEWDEGSTGTPDRPEPPPHMTEESVAEWDWLCDHLEEMGLLSGSDVALMAIYCDAWAQYREICEELKESGMIAMGKTGYYIAAQMNVQAMLRKQIRDVAGELGLSAVARARLHVGKTRKESDDDEKLLKVVVG